MLDERSSTSRPAYEQSITHRKFQSSAIKARDAVSVVPCLVSNKGTVVETAQTRYSQQKEPSSIVSLGS